MSLLSPISGKTLFLSRKVSFYLLVPDSVVITFHGVICRFNYLLSLFHIQQLDIEDQGCVGRDHSGGAPRAVAQVGRDFQLPLAAHLHACDAIVPALNHLSATQLELKRSFADGAVELLAAGQPARVIYGHFFSGNRRCSRASYDNEVPNT